VSGRVINGFHVGGRLVPSKPHHLRLADFNPNVGAFGPTPASTSFGSAPYAQACLTDILGNDRYGDCTEADQFHRQSLRQAAAGKPVFHPTLDQVLAVYTRDGGMPGDQGCDETVVLGNGCTHGIPSDNAGCLDKPAGFLLVDATNRDLVRAVVSNLVGANICMGLPDAWTNDMPSSPGWTWDVPTGGFVANPNSGHAFTLADQTEQNLRIWSWGMPGFLTYDALAAGATTAGGGGLYVELDEDTIIAGAQRAPDGLDWKALVTAFDAVGGTVAAPSGSPTLLQRIESALGRLLR